MFCFFVCLFFGRKGGGGGGENASVDKRGDAAVSHKAALFELEFNTRLSFFLRVFFFFSFLHPLVLEQTEARG